MTTASTDAAVRAAEILSALAGGRGDAMAARHRVFSAALGVERGHVVAQAATIRSAAVNADVKASAAGVLACRPAVIPMVGPAFATIDVLDAWCADYVHVRTGSLPPARGAVGVDKVEPSTCGKNVGAVQAAVGRILSMRPDWTLTREAREECGCGDHRRGGEHRTEKSAVLPREVFLKFGRQDQVGSLRRRRNGAAMVMATVFGGLPVSAMPQIRPDELKLTNGESGPAGTLRYEGTRKVHRVRRVPKTYKATVYCGASPMIANILEPWLARATASNWDRLFPHIVQGRVVKGDVPAEELESAIKDEFDGATWHGLRVGFARALMFVHRVPGGPECEVKDTVANASQGRSNRVVRGSRDVYVKEVAEDLWKATAALHRVDVRDEDGVLRLHIWDPNCAACAGAVDFEDLEAELCHVAFCPRLRCAGCSAMLPEGAGTAFGCEAHPITT